MSSNDASMGYAILPVNAGWLFPVLCVAILFHPGLLLCQGLQNRPPHNIGEQLFENDLFVAYRSLRPRGPDYWCYSVENKTFDAWISIVYKKIDHKITLDEQYRRDMSRRILPKVRDAGCPPRGRGSKGYRLRQVNVDHYIQGARVDGTRTVHGLDAALPFRGAEFPLASLVVKVEGKNLHFGNLQSPLRAGQSTTSLADLGVDEDRARQLANPRRAANTPQTVQDLLEFAHDPQLAADVLRVARRVDDFETDLTGHDLFLYADPLPGRPDINGRLAALRDEMVRRGYRCEGATVGRTSLLRNYVQLGPMNFGLHVVTLACVKGDCRDIVFSVGAKKDERLTFFRNHLGFPAFAFRDATLRAFSQEPQEIALRFARITEAGIEPLGEDTKLVSLWWQRASPFQSGCGFQW